MKGLKGKVRFFCVEVSGELGLRKFHVANWKVGVHAVVDAKQMAEFEYNLALQKAKEHTKAGKVEEIPYA